MTRRNYTSRSRLTTLFALTGGVLWIAAALFIGWAFAVTPGRDDWVLMHQEKMNVALGVGLAGIGSLFLCFAGLLKVVSTGRGNM
ncbi:hypothetical protein [Sphingomonas adhaesiva]|uniref:hypothetical protein n=1 Tax=Sphingomonas adhaesiva TaxID=28212 RepID=UPI002FF4D00E